MERPVIGILASKYTFGKWNLLQHGLGDNYVRSIEEAGGLAMIIPHLHILFTSYRSYVVFICIS